MVALAGETHAAGLSGGPPLGEAPAQNPKVIGQNPQADPAFQPGSAMVAAAIQAKAAPQDADPSLDPRPESMGTPEPPLSLMWRLGAASSRNADPSDAQAVDCLLVFDRPEAAVSSDQRRRMTEAGRMVRHAGHQVGRIRGIPGEDLIVRHQSTLHLIEDHFGTELGGLACLPASDQGGLRLEQAQDLLGGGDRLPTKHPSLGLLRHPLQQGLEPIELCPEALGLLSRRLQQEGTDLSGLSHRRSGNAECPPVEGNAGLGCRLTVSHR